MGLKGSMEIKKDQERKRQEWLRPEFEMGRNLKVPRVCPAVSVVP